MKEVVLSIVIWLTALLMAYVVGQNYARPLLYNIGAVIVVVLILSASVLFAKGTSEKERKNEEH